MASSEVSTKGNCSNGRGESFSSACGEVNGGVIGRDGMAEALKVHPSFPGAGKF